MSLIFQEKHFNLSRESNHRPLANSRNPALKPVITDLF